MDQQQKRVLVPIGTGFEEIETCSTVDILRRGGASVTLASVMGKETGLTLKGAQSMSFVCDAVSLQNNLSTLKMSVTKNGI